MEQFISMELIKLYTKKFKYSDFDWVVRSAIRRKAIDFDAKIKRSYRNLIFENQKNNPLFNTFGGTKDKGINPGDINTDDMFYSGIKSIKKWNDHSADTKVIDFINDIIYKITEGRLKDKFTEWDREYLDSLLFLYSIGYREFPKEDVIECMGYDLSEALQHSSKLNSFRNRLKKYISLEMDFV